MKLVHYEKQTNFADWPPVEVWLICILEPWESSEPSAIFVADENGDKVWQYLVNKQKNTEKYGACGNNLSCAQVGILFIIDPTPSEDFVNKIFGFIRENKFDTPKTAR